MFGDQVEQVAAVHDQEFALIGGDGGGGAGAAIEQRDFTEHISGEVFREDDGLAGAIFHVNLHAAAAHNEKRFARIAVSKDNLALVEGADIEQPGERLTLFVVEQLE